MNPVQIPEVTPRVPPTHTSRPPGTGTGSRPHAGGRGIGPLLLTRVRTAPESVKRRLRPILVWLVRAAIAMPGGRRGARAVMRRMPETSSWLVRRYEIYRQMSLRQGENRRRFAIAGADDLSQGEAVCLQWLSSALRPPDPVSGNASPSRATAP